MNRSEFNKDFDLKYNNATSFSAAPISMYMKSLYLTDAEEEIVLELYEKVDSDEKVREQLRKITKNETINYDNSLNASLAGSKFNTNSKFFEVNSNVWFLLSEYINSNVPVIPTPIDEYNLNIKNPFKKPIEGERAWRLELGNDDKNIREIIYPAAISTYTIRYLEKPDPIILEDLTPYGVTIDGISAPTECKLSSELHRAIVNRAVEKAIKTYKENTLQATQVAGGRDN